MLGAMSSGIRSLLWAVDVALAIVIVAVFVSPVYTTGNMASWLASLGMNGPANWLIAHAQHSVHLSTRSIAHLVTTRDIGLNVSEVALYASGALLACSVILWLLPIIRR